MIRRKFIKAAGICFSFVLALTMTCVPVYAEKSTETITEETEELSAENVAAIVADDETEEQYQEDVETAEPETDTPETAADIQEDDSDLPESGLDEPADNDIQETENGISETADGVPENETSMDETVTESAGDQDVQDAAVILEADENITSGKCGDSVSWELTETDDGYRLDITGNGDMYDYLQEDETFVKQYAPWYSQRENITEVCLASGITGIGDGAFYYCSEVVRIEIPESVKTIGSYAFFGCSCLRILKVSGGLDSIGFLPFSGCPSLTIYCYKGSKIEDYAENNDIICVSFEEGTEIVVPETDSDELPSGKCGDNVSWELTDNGSGYTLSITGSGDMYDYIEYEYEDSDVPVEYAPWNYYKDKITSVHFDDGITRIGGGALLDCKNVTALDIPEAVTGIGDAALSGCTGLQELVLPEGLTELGNYTVSGCTSLTEIDLPDGLKEIKQGAFSGCSSLQKISIPESVEEIGLYAFSKCDKLTIYGSKDSKAYTYAQKYGINFVQTGDREEDVTEISLNETYIELANKSSVQLYAIEGSDGTDRQSVTWESSNPQIASVDSDGTVTAIQYGTAEITATLDSNPEVSASCTVQTRFSDVADRSLYYFKTVYWAAENNIASGYSRVYFGPDIECTREQFARMLWNLAGRPEASKSIKFTDINYHKDSIAYRSIAWAYSAGIVKGYSDGTFRPDAAITRKQAVIMLYRYAGCPAVSGENRFSDTTYKKGSDSYKAVIWGTTSGIIGGYSDGTFRPDESCLRKHIVTFLFRMKK